MSKTKIKVVWSNDAKADLHYIYKRTLRKTKSLINSKNVKKDILQSIKDIQFPEQYQVDEFLGVPYRRVVVRHFKVIYVVENETSIIILEIFDTHRSPSKMRKG